MYRTDVPLKASFNFKNQLYDLILFYTGFSQLTFSQKAHKTEICCNINNKMENVESFISPGFVAGTGAATLVLASGLAYVMMKSNKNHESR